MNGMGVGATTSSSASARKTSPVSAKAVGNKLVGKKAGKKAGGSANLENRPVWRSLVETRDSVMVPVVLPTSGPQQEAGSAYWLALGPPSL